MERTARRQPDPRPKPKKKFSLTNIGSFDIPFFAIVIILMTIGLIMMFSASYAYAYYHDNGDSFAYIKKQLLFAVVGVIGMLVVSKINYRVLQSKLVVYGISLATLGLLAVVLVLPEQKPGFKRWIDLGFTTFQPSELAKFTVILLFAYLIALHVERMKKFSYGVVLFVGLLGVFAGLIFLENHLSGTLLVVGIGAVLMYVGGTKKKWFLIGLLAIVGLLVLIMVTPKLMDHAKPRIEAWLNKDYDPKGDRWQTNQSLYAIGSGGFLGAGIGNSKQKYLYVSEPQNDFIFSIVCEELGFVGAAIIIGLFILLIWRAFTIAVKAPDKFGMLLVIGIAAQVGLQTVLNIAVVSDTIPNTGISLPFFSYGGTALTMLLLEMGVILSVSRQANLEKL